MASLTLPYPNFTNGQTADADQVDANLEAIVTFLSTLVPHTDGTNAFTGLPVLPATSPGNTNPTTKLVVDTIAATRVKSIYPTAQVYMQSGSASGTTDGSGNLTVTCGGTFPNAAYVVLVAPTTQAAAVRVTAKTTTTFTITAAVSTAVAFDWIALSV